MYYNKTMTEEAARLPRGRGTTTSSADRQGRQSNYCFTRRSALEHRSVAWWAYYVPGCGLRWQIAIG
jgi:hypothetical protein